MTTLGKVANFGLDWPQIINVDCESKMCIIKRRRNILIAMLLNDKFVLATYIIIIISFSMRKFTFRQKKPITVGSTYALPNSMLVKNKNKRWVHNQFSLINI